MSFALESQIEAALRQVRDTDQGGDIVSLHMVKGLQIRGGHVIFSIEVDPKRGPALESLRQQAEAVVRAIPGVTAVQAVLTAERAPAQAQTPADPHGMNKNPVRAPSRAASIQRF